MCIILIPTDTIRAKQKRVGNLVQNTKLVIVTPVNVLGKGAFQQEEHISHSGK